MVTFNRTGSLKNIHQSIRSGTTGQDNVTKHQHSSPKKFMMILSGKGG